MIGTWDQDKKKNHRQQDVKLYIFFNFGLNKKIDHR
jgi:hypothetical protein